MYPHLTRIFEYTIQPYDNYWQLAQRFNTTVEKIMVVNPGVNPNNLLVGQVIRIPTSVSAGPPPYIGETISRSEAEFRSMMRLLWQEHISWARMVMVSLAYDLPDADAVVARLMENPVEMGNMLKPLYGEYIGNQYTGLIKEHLELAGELITTMKAGDAKGTAALEKSWYANGEQISDFLSSINPLISKERFREMFYSHLGLTQDEARAVINQDFKEDIESFDKIEMEAIAMADMLSNAIVQQYSGYFR